MPLLLSNRFTMKYSIILILIVAANFQSCIKKYQDCPARFQIPAQVIPYSEEYSIGDTITIFSKFNKNVYELNTERTYDMEGIKWYPATGIMRIDTVTEIQY